VKKNLSPLAASVVALMPFGLVILGFVLLGYYFWKKGNQQNAAAEEARAETSALSYPISAYAGFADQIHAGGFAALGTDEDAIFGVFSKMKTRADVLQLIQSFGQRRAEYSATSLGLSGFLASELDSDDITGINDILAAKGIAYAF